MVLLSEDKAKAVAEVLNRGNGEDDWYYEASCYSTYRFVIKVYDENNEFLGYL